MKKWLNARKPANNLEELNQLLQQFQTLYNTTRPHRSLNRQTPATAYNALPKAEPTINDPNHTWRIRHDKINEGVITYRYAGKLKHLAVGRAHNHKKVLILASGPNTMIIDRKTGEILAEHQIDTNKDYQPKKPQPHEQ